VEQVLSKPHPHLGEAAAKPAEGARNNYNQILKSSALIGGASLINLLIGLIRTKAMALMLGPAGFGLIGVYGSITEVVRSVAGMGVSSSAVREIAAATGSTDQAVIASTVYTVRRAVVGLGLVGAVLLWLLARPVSVLTFGSEAHASDIALLSLAVLLRLVADGQGALVQGMRRILDLAKISVAGALLGAVTAVLIIFALGQDGIAPALVAVAASSALASWHYSRKVRLNSRSIPLREIVRTTASLLKLGSAFMLSGLVMMGTMYVINALLWRAIGQEGVGLYQAAWTLGGLYIGFILQAMGTDFYPRLVAVASDDERCNRLVNEQAHVSLLLAAPGVIATLALAPVALKLFYSQSFAEATTVLRWLCLGMSLRVISWPLGFVIVARARQTLYMATEIAWAVVNVGLTWSWISYFGVEGVGMAFFASYVFHCAMIYIILRRMTGFRWLPENRSTGALFLASVGLVFVACVVLPPVWATAIGILATIGASIVSLKILLVHVESVPRPIRRLFARFPGGPQGVRADTSLP
jgi:PST family polysaccharide transporter